MGARNADRFSLLELRHHGETLALMWKNDWRVRAYCESCGIELEVNLEVLIRVNGPGLSLWNRTTPCKRVDCHGRMFFKAKAPGMNGFQFVGRRQPRVRVASRDPLAFGKVTLQNPPEDDGLV